MRYLLAVLTSFILSLSLFSKDSYAFGGINVAGASASLSKSKIAKDKRPEKLRAFLKSYNSPLTPYSEFIVKTADQYSLDWKLVPAISGVESTFGRQIPYNSYNAYGWNNGYYYFKDWPEGIKIVSQSLKENYLDRGVKTVWQIGPIYAPPSPFWAGKVAYFMKKIENFDSSSTLQLTL